MNCDFKEIKKGEKHLGAYTDLDLYTTHDGESFQLYKKAGMRLEEIRESQERLPSSLYIKRDDAIREVQMLQQEMDKELDGLLGQESPPAERAHSLVEDALELAADGLKELSQLGEKDPEKTAEALDGVKHMTENVVSKCLEDKIFLENMLTVARTDFNTFQHSIQVAMYAMSYSTYQRFLSTELQPLVLGAMLHDIGIVFLPENTLRNAGRYTQDDYEQMHSHPKLGYDVLRDVFEDKRIARVCLEHHERLDGSGYPIGHNESHEWSKLIAIIEVFDGMVGWRPHRVAPGPIEAIKTLDLMADNGELSRPLVNGFCNSLVGKVIGRQP